MTFRYCFQLVLALLFLVFAGGHLAGCGDPQLRQSASFSGQPDGDEDPVDDLGDPSPSEDGDVETAPPQSAPPSAMPPASDDPEHHKAYCLQLFLSHGVHRVLVMGHRRNVHVDVDHDLVLMVIGTKNQVNLSIESEDGLSRVCIIELGNKNKVLTNLSSDLDGFVQISAGNKNKSKVTVSAGSEISMARGVLAGNKNELKIEGHSVTPALCTNIRRVGHHNKVECGP